MSDIPSLCNANLPWTYSAPFIRYWKVGPESIDHYQHVNNVAYLSRTEKLAWAHSESLGIGFKEYESIKRAMVIQQHQLNYLLPAHLGDELACATWITFTDQKFRLERYFEFFNINSKKRLFTANTKFVCCALKSGRPKVMPDRFKSIYGQACIAQVEQLQNREVTKQNRTVIANE